MCGKTKEKNSLGLLTTLIFFYSYTHTCNFKEVLFNGMIFFFEKTMNKYLYFLYISGCEELVHIVEEDYESNGDDHMYHEQCFTILSYVNDSNCDTLKY